MTPNPLKCLPEKAQGCPKKSLFVIANTWYAPQLLFLRAFTKKDLQLWILSLNPWDVFVSLTTQESLSQGLERHCFEIQSSGRTGLLSPGLCAKITASQQMETRHLHPLFVILHFPALSSTREGEETHSQGFSWTTAQKDTPLLSQGVCLWRTEAGAPSPSHPKSPAPGICSLLFIPALSKYICSHQRQTSPSHSTQPL